MAPAGSTSRSDDSPLGERRLSRLRWRCRRGMLENDLFLQRFFDRHAGSLTQRQGRCLNELMDLGDNDLLDLLLGRYPLSHVNPELDRIEVVEVLGMLRENR